MARSGGSDRGQRQQRDTSIRLGAGLRSNIPFSRYAYNSVPERPEAFLSWGWARRASSTSRRTLTPPSKARVLLGRTLGGGGSVTLKLESRFFDPGLVTALERAGHAVEMLPDDH